MRKLIAIMFVAALSLSACGGGADQASEESTNTTQLSPQDIVRASLGQTESQTAKTDLTMSLTGIEGQTEPVNFNGTGAFDMATGNGQMKLNMPIQGIDIGVEMLIVDQVYFYKYAGADGTGLTEKPWLRATAEDLVGQDGAQAVGQASNSPADGLKIFETAGADITEVGKEQVRGAEATHYKVSLNPAQLAQSDDEAVRNQAEQLQKVYGNNTIPADIWIDGQQRVVKYSMTLDLSSLQGQAAEAVASGTAVVTMEIYDYGTPVEVSAPPADQVMDFKQAMASMGASAGI